MHISVSCNHRHRPVWAWRCVWVTAALLLLSACAPATPEPPLPLTLRRTLPSLAATHTATAASRTTPTPTPTCTGVYTPTPHSASLPLIVEQGTPTPTASGPLFAGTPAGDSFARPPETPPTPTATPDPCTAFVQREGDHLVLDGQPFAFVGLNATSLMDEGLPEAELPAILDTLQSWGVTVLRIWVKPGWDLERLDRLLSLSASRDIRYVITLQDYYHYKDHRWFSTTYLTEDLPHIEEVVTRFRDRPEIAIWEVMNEPWCGAPGEASDRGCYRILQAWAEETTALIKRLDPCRPVSLGTMGARHLEIEREAYRALSAIETVDILSMHRVPGDWYQDPLELEIARELNKPIMLGEVAVLGYSQSCEQLGPFVVPERARLLAADMHKALELGVDGYLLWDYAPGTVQSPDGKIRHFCSIYGFFSNDPIGEVIRALDIVRVPVRSTP